MPVKLPVNINDDALPETYRWVGEESPFWDDPNNWDLRKVPNHAEATVIFGDLNESSAIVQIRKPVVLANLWFDCSKTSYSIESATNAGADCGIFFSTGQQLANIVLTSANRVNHVIPAMIMHSCKKLWGPRWFIKTIPFSEQVSEIEYEPSLSKITFSGPIGSYKEAPRASLNVDGDIDVELSGNNTFIGPIDVRRGSLIISDSQAIPVGSVMHVYRPGKVVVAPGVLIKLKQLWVDGVQLEDGEYSSNVLSSKLHNINNNEIAIVVDSSLKVVRE